MPKKPAPLTVSISVPDVAFGGTTIASVSPDNGSLWVQYWAQTATGASFGNAKVVSGKATITISPSPTLDSGPADGYAQVLDYANFDYNSGKAPVVGKTTFKVL